MRKLKKEKEREGEGQREREREREREKLKKREERDELITCPVCLPRLTELSMSLLADLHDHDGDEIGRMRHTPYITRVKKACLLLELPVY